MLLAEQLWPQPPQLAGSAVGSTHAAPQISSEPGQSHWPPLQVAVTGHAAPQAPQFAASVSVLVSQPSPSLSALQSAVPAAQVPSHTPAVQVGNGTLFVEHARPQPPQ
jgi:hypothetical protein